MPHAFNCQAAAVPSGLVQSGIGGFIAADKAPSPGMHALYSASGPPMDRVISNAPMPVMNVS